MEPLNPIDAVQHRDPYPYYERLLDGPLLHYDDGLKMWIAARAAAVAEVFDSPACRVRPTAEPVPAPLQGLPAGEIFGHLVRMNDGARHDQPKLALERALATLPRAHVEARARDIAQIDMPQGADAPALSQWIFDTPVTVVADLLGFARDEQRAVANWTREFAACLSPLSTAEQLVVGSAAASHLRQRMQSLVQSAQPRQGSLLARVCHEAQALGWANGAAVVANLVGLLSQTYEATGGLIGNAMVALGTHPHLLNEVRATPGGWEQWVQETGRYDSPVQNTRRFVSERTCIAGVELEQGAAVLLVLAAANRDPEANPHPNQFMLERPDRCVFSFSRGAHACPGQVLAQSIAAAALAVLCSQWPADGFERMAWSWRPSANGRLPVFHSVGDAEVLP